MISYLFNRIIKKLHLPAIKNSVVHKTSKVEGGSSFINSKMEKYSFCGYQCDIQNTEIGSFVSIANNVIIGGGMHPVDWASTSPVFYDNRDSVKKKFSRHKRVANLKVVIGHDVWIGNNCLIKQGVQIGHGSVIGMGAIVTKDVAPYTIVAGSPAKLIRNRFDESVSNALLESAWWDLDEEKLEELSIYICEPSKFLAELKKIKSTQA